MSSTHFYRAFEERYRGSRELIRSRLQAYQPFIFPLLDIYQPAQAVDVGCGRGEWLELLQSLGFTPKGVDLDAGMLTACTERGLPAVQGDALAYLQSLDDASQCLVSGFHFVEHIPFEYFESLVQQALRVLKPGGLLILETPNPENLVVGTNNFYLDPTHLRPIPAQLLSFVPEYYGFSRVHTLRLQEVADLHKKTDIGLIDVLNGVSPDYAVVAQKGANPEILTQFDAVFSSHYGLSLNQLANQYDGTQLRRTTHFERGLVKIEEKINNSFEHLSDILENQRKANILIEKLLSAQERLFIESSENSRRLAASEAICHSQKIKLIEITSSLTNWQQKTKILEADNKALKQSISWRATAPLRWFGLLFQRGVYKPAMDLNKKSSFSRNPIILLMHWIIKKPALAEKINNYLINFPTIHQKLLNIARHHGIISEKIKYTKDSSNKAFTPLNFISYDANPASSDSAKIIKKSEDIVISTPSSSDLKEIEKRLKITLHDLMRK